MKIERVARLDPKEVHRRSAHTARSRKRSERRSEPFVFVGIDTEGSGKGTDHRPVLVSCGAAYLSDAAGLDWARVFDFLYSQFQEGGYVYGGFYLSYDFTQWLRSLPEERARMLLTAEGKAARVVRRRNGAAIKGAPPYPVEHKGWEFDILGMKRLRIRPRGESRWMYICDGGPFWQCSFLKAIDPDRWTEPICTPEEFARVAEGKAYRSDAVLDDNMIEYQQLEVEIWARLMNALDIGLRSLGIHLQPKQWMGPGQVAQEWLKGQDVPKLDELSSFMPDSYFDAARATYFGGWFEIFMHGHIPGITWEYDINSAYPYIIAKLPCLRHGRYSHGKGKPELGDGALCIVRGTARTLPADPLTYDSDRDFPIGAMLHRDFKGRIFRPHDTTGTWWLHELQAAERAGVVNQITYKEWWAYEPCDCEPPLAKVEELYYQRVQVGKNTALGKAIKLLINSVYGKFAQSIGDPMYGNPVYASLITAGCRTMILDAIATHPEGAKAVAMVATDGVYFLSPHPTLQLSSNLGDWEVAQHHNMCLFKPGVYWSDKSRKRIAEGKSPEFKSRGINPADFAVTIAEVDRIFSEWPKLNKNGLPATIGSENHGWGRPKRDKKTGKITGGKRWPIVEFTAHFSMVSITQAAQDGWEWSRAGEVSDSVILQQNAHPGEKRSGIYYDPEKDVYRSYPKRPGFFEGGTPVSVPYEKRFGKEDPWSDESLEELGIGPDGNVGEIISGVLMERG